MEQWQYLKRAKGKFNLTFILLLSFLILFSGNLPAQENDRLSSLQFDPISQAQSTYGPVIEEDTSSGSQAGEIAESLRERIQSIRGNVTNPDNAPDAGKAVQGGKSFAPRKRVKTIRSARNPFAPGKNLSGAYRGVKVPSLQHRTDEVKVWFRSVPGTPRQIKLRDEARRRGVVLEDAMSTLMPGRERDEQSSRKFLNSQRALLRISNPDEELKLSRYQKDRLGRRHIRYAQRYRDLPVWPAELNIHLDQNGNVDLMNGAYISTPRRLVTNPVWSSAEAVEKARDEVPGGEKAVTGEPLLIIYAPGDRLARLAWKVEVPVSINSNWFVIIDALNGKTLRAYNRIPNENVSGSGLDLFGHTRQLNVWHENNQYYLVDTTKQMYDSAYPTLDPVTTRGTIMVRDMANTEISQDGNIQSVHITSLNPAAGWLKEGVSLATICQRYTIIIWSGITAAPMTAMGPATLPTYGSVTTIRMPSGVPFSTQCFLAMQSRMPGLST